MIYSMTGYASATRELAAASGTGGVSVSVELRTVNSRFLDLNFRMPEDVRVCEPTLREMLMTKLSRGKVDIRINVQRSEQGANAGALNRDVLDQLATLERAVLEAFPESGHLRTGEILRWLGGFRRPPRKTFIVHGEPNASDALRLQIEDKLGWACVIPEMMERHTL